MATPKNEIFWKLGGCNVYRRQPHLAAEHRVPLRLLLTFDCDDTCINSSLYNAAPTYSQPKLNFLVHSWDRFSREKLSIKVQFQAGQNMQAEGRNTDSSLICIANNDIDGASMVPE
jgi:hypothetical protein